MKRILLFLNLFFCLISKAQITAQFTLNPSKGCAIPHTVFFTDQSTLPDTWLWNFGDGGASTLQNPVHNYTATGNYIVTLIITDTIIGTSDTAFATVDVSIPTANFTGNGSSAGAFGCAPLSVAYVSTSTSAASIMSWNWDFGDGNTDTTENPTHIYQNPGVYTVSLSITDSNGCTSTEIKNTFVQVIGLNVNFGADTLFNCQVPLNVNFTDSTIFGAPITSWTWDFGDGNSSNLQNPMHTYTTNDTFTVSLTVTDIDGCSRTFTRNKYISTLDQIAPTISCIGNQTVAGDTNCEISLADYTGLIMTTDSCDSNPTITQSPLAGTMLSSDTTVWIYSTDVSGNVDSCSFSVAIADSTVPVITCISNQIVAGDTNCEITLADYTGLITTTDNCDSNPTVTQNPSAGTLLSVDTMIWMYSTDASGNVDSCSFTVAIVDSSAPVITCIANQIVAGDTNCEITLADYTGLITTVDNCDTNLTVTQNPVPGTTVSNDTVVWMYSLDASGNIDSCSFTVTIADSTAPSITCIGNQTIAADVNCQITLADYTTSITTTDNCDSNPTVTQNPISGTLLSTDTTVWMYSTDSSGNIDSCSFTVTIADSTAPVITCISNQIVAGDTNCEITLTDYTGLITTTDNCDGNPIVTQNPISGTLLSTDTTVWIYSTDASGNVDSCSFTVTIADSTAPSITCIGNQTVAGNVNCEITLADYRGMIITTDNCDPNPTITQLPVVGTTLSNDTIVWMYSTDVSGNIDSCSFTFTIADSTAPSITCIGNQTIAADVNCEITLADYTTLITTIDNCDGNPTVTQNPIAGTLLSADTTIWMYSMDVSGNVDSCSFTVTIADSTAPTFTCPNDTSLPVGNNCNITVPDFISALTVSDNCDSNPTITQNPIAGSSISSNTTIQITATDISGNNFICNVNITLLDTIMPTIVCPSDTESCISVITYQAPLGSDNCSAFTISQNDGLGLSSGDEFPIGTTTLSYQIEDGGGNTSSCTFDIVVNPSPIIDAGDDVSIEEKENFLINATSDGEYIYEWTPIEGLDTSTILTPTLSISETTVYTLKATNSHNCIANDEIEITTIPQSKLVIYNVVTPNGNGKNDTWSVNNPDLISGCKVSVYNRWGTLIYQTDNYNNEWDATKDGTPLPDGTYYYVISCEGKEDLTGPITVIKID